MKPPYITQAFLDQFIANALQEDVGDGDHSSLAAIAADQDSKARLLIKQDGVLAGVELADAIFKAIDKDLKIEYFKADGDLVKKGEEGFVVTGNTQSILKAERLVLNCMQRMSGIATKTHQLNQLISHTSARLLDTRKTTPNFRLLEKWAVAIGGGQNHRIGLYDLIMLKDNHIDFAGGIAQAIQATKSYLQSTNRSLRIEVETRSIDEVQQVLKEGGIDIIMLDNMSPQLMKEAVGLIDGRYETEASGGITGETIAAVAESGVDYISVGALTHSYESIDLSLKALT
ncbi:MAG: carboxylating nicotinate-nucleotide diphosphorylase [Cyclobacteriaceae bacterium]